MRGVPRPEWPSVPPAVRDRMERAIGFRVESWITSGTGFSEGFAGVVSGDGRRAFVKAASRLAAPESARLHALEAENIERVGSPPAPRLMAIHDDGDWVAIALEAIDGRPPGRPWSDADLDAVLDAVRELATVRVEGMPSATAIATKFVHWPEIGESPALMAQLPAAVAGLVDPLARREAADAVRAAEGATLSHLDVRDDNVLIDRRGRVRLVDWPHSAVGSPWLDLTFFAPSVPMGGGPSAGAVARRYLGGAEAPDDLVTLASSWAGRILWMSVQPEPPGLAGLREFQRVQSVAALDWLAELLG